MRALRVSIFQCRQRGSLALFRRHAGEGRSPRWPAGIGLGIAVASMLLGMALAGPASALAPPANDTFAGATVIGSLPYSTTEDSTGATADPIDAQVGAACGLAPSPSPAPDFSVWFNYIPTVDQTIQVDTSGSNYMTATGVVTGSPGSFQQAACFAGQGTFSVTAGQTYHMLIVDLGTAPTGGTLKLSVTLAPPPPPPPSAHLELNRTGHVDPETGVATITGTLTCTGLFGLVQMQLTQGTGNEERTGFGARRQQLATGCRNRGRSQLYPPLGASSLVAPSSMRRVLGATSPGYAVPNRSSGRSPYNAGQHIAALRTAGLVADAHGASFRLDGGRGSGGVRRALGRPL